MNSGVSRILTTVMMLAMLALLTAESPSATTRPRKPLGGRALFAVTNYSLSVSFQASSSPSFSTSG